MGWSNIFNNKLPLASVCVYALQEMAVRALKQTGSRNIEAALEYISKMGYLDPRNELIVRVIKQTSPGTLNLKTETLSSKYEFCPQFLYKKYHTPWYKKI